MKKILILTVGFNGGGSGKIAALMENFLNKSYKTVTVVFSKDTKIFKIRGKKINVGNLFNFSFPGGGYIQLIFHIISTIKYIKKEKPDIVIGIGTYGNFLGLVARKFLRFKLLLSQHEHITSRKSNLSTLELYNFIFLMTRVLIGNNKIICVSDEVRSDTIKNYRIKESQAQTIYNGLDFREINKLGNEKIDINNKYIINIGWLNVGKNQKLLINAYSKSKIKEKYKLVLLGEGYMEQPLKNLCKTLNIEDSVIFAGFDKNPYKYLKKASLFCFTSLTEALPTVLIESLILNIPIITVPVTGANEILNNGMFGVITKDWDEGNLIEELNNFVEGGNIYFDANKLENFINKNFSIEAMEQKYLETIRNL